MRKKLFLQLRHFGRRPGDPHSRWRPRPGPHRVGWLRAEEQARIVLPGAETLENPLVGFVCVICMCRDKTNTGTAIALEPWRPTPSGAHTSSIGPRTTILGGWKPPHSSMTAGRWIAGPILSHFAKRTKFWLAMGCNAPRGV